MEKYVAFLRGVNMAGHNKIKMADLKKMFIGLGYPDAETYIQSGNVVFTPGSGETASSAELKIEEEISKKFGLEIAAIVRTGEELLNILNGNPYLKEAENEHSKIAAVLLKERPTEQQTAKMDGIHYPPDEYSISGKEIYIHCPNGFGRTKLYTNFFENKMKATGTARNWNSMKIIAGMAGVKQP